MACLTCYRSQTAQHRFLRNNPGKPPVQYGLQTELILFNSLTTVGYLLDVFIKLWIPSMVHFHFCFELALETSIYSTVQSFWLCYKLLLELYALTLAARSYVLLYELSACLYWGYDQNLPLYVRSIYHCNGGELCGRWRTSGKRWSAETEVWKRKYGNRSTEVRRKAAYWCLVPYWLMTVRCRQWVTGFKRCESQVLTHWTPSCTNSHLAWTQCLVLVSFRWLC